MRPTRETVRKHIAAYFASTQTTGRKAFFRHERWARLMMATLVRYAEKDFILHAYVIMPDHLHLLITPAESLERAIQLIKGGFSFRARRELDWKFDIWQPGFTDLRIRDEEDWKRHLEYIRTNPVEARLVEDSGLYEFMGFPNIAFPQGLKPVSISAANVRAEARTLRIEPQNLEGRGADALAEARTLQEAPADASLEEMTDAASSSRRVRPLGRTSQPANGRALAPEGGKR